MADSLGYLIEATKMQGHIQGVLPHDDEQLLNAHLVDDFSLTLKLTQNYVEGTMQFLGIIDRNLIVIVSE